MTDLLAHVESIWQAVAPVLPTFTVEVVPSIDSTSSELMRRARGGLLEPVLLAAEEQTAGRGRMGKGWHSRAGQSLTFSLALPLTPADWSGLSLAVGVSLAESLHPAVKIKWPNDLWYDERKLVGILVETAGSGEGATVPRTVVVGIGINIARPDVADTAAPAASVLAAAAPAGLAELHMGMTAGEALERVAPALVNDLLRFGRDGFTPFAERFAQRDALTGRAVRLSDGTEGTAEGVDAQGALRVQTTQGLRIIHSAEVSVRPC
ncbi:MAG: biotin--[acetyl-CoA-carboxylase] ligase [Hydrogenophaga sp.]|nr:biotin--[acetyl-CoA-carboxylase] ligase [Hydrogenophaga sp.]